MRYKHIIHRHLGLISHRLYRQLKGLPRHVGRHVPALVMVVALLALSLGIAWAPFSFLSPPATPTSASFSSPSLPSRSFPILSANNIFVEDLDSGLVLYQKSADEEIYPASTTKIATALVVLNSFPLDQVITVTRSYPEGENIGFLPGEKTTVDKLLYALLVQSGNDAAEILAENYPGGRSAFISAMNTKIADLGLKHTHFVNPTGLDEDGHYSSASDLARLAVLALTNPLFARIVSTQNAVINSSDIAHPHILTNTNELLGKIPGVLGVKTGFTDKAGQSLISLVNRRGRRILFVVLGSTDRFGDTEKLIDWAYSPD